MTGQLERVGDLGGGNDGVELLNLSQLKGLSKKERRQRLAAHSERILEGPGNFEQAILKSDMSISEELAQQFQQRSGGAIAE